MALDFTRRELEAPRDLVLSATIPLSPEEDPVNSLTQVRRTMTDEGIADLAHSILAQGQHTPGVVVFLNPDQAKNYVRELNELWGTRHRLSHLQKITLDGEEGYFALIAGHRRKNSVLEAIRLMKEGEQPGEKFTGKYLCDIYFGLTVEEAITIQFHENRHQQVPVQEEVRAALCTWKFMLKRHPDLTRRKFGDVVGRAPGWVTRMVRFSTLPSSAQELIDPNEEGNRVSYQLLCEVARLIEGEDKAAERAEAEDRVISVMNWTEEAILSYINHLVVKRVKPKDFAKEVSKRLWDLEHGQGDLLMGDAEVPSLRKVAVPELVRSIHAALNYWRAVEQIRQQGGFDPDGTPFAPEGKSEYSPQSVLRLALKNLQVLWEITPHLCEMALREKRYRRKLEQAAKRAEISMMVFETIAETA